MRSLDLCPTEDELNDVLAEVSFKSLSTMTSCTC